jgi:hypothetical protein
MTTDDATTVRALLGAARIPASDAEVSGLTAAYPGIRAGIEELYATPEARYMDPALRFRAEAVGPDTDWAS